jgi:hypothetical protein
MGKYEEPLFHNGKIRINHSNIGHTSTLEEFSLWILIIHNFNLLEVSTLFPAWDAKKNFKELKHCKLNIIMNLNIAYRYKHKV